MYIGKNKPDLYSVYPIDALCDLRSDVFMFALLGLSILIIYFTFFPIQCSAWSRRNWKTPLTTTITAWNSKFISRSQLQMTGHVNVSALQASFACKSVLYETDHNLFSLCLNCIYRIHSRCHWLTLVFMHISPSDEEESAYESAICVHM